MAFRNNAVTRKEIIEFSAGISSADLCRKDSNKKDIIRYRNKKLSARIEHSKPNLLKFRTLSHRIRLIMEEIAVSAMCGTVHSFRRRKDFTMCGIIGYTGTENAVPKLLYGLSALEYRGYDSAGIALAEKDSLTVIKSEGRLDKLRQKLEKIQGL